MAILAIIVGWSLFHHSQSQTTRQPELVAGVTTITNQAVQVPATNLVVQQSPITAANTNDSGSEDIESRYRQGLIGKEQAIQETYLERNKRSQDFYGKVIDQYGQPVTGVGIAGELVFNTETYGGVKTENYTAQTDSEGLFQFTGLNGAGFNVRLSKDGYKMGERGEGYKGPAGSKTNPNDRAILTMWKLRGAEPLISSDISSKIPYDGNSSTFDVATGKESPDGDLKVTLSRFPLKIKPGLVHPYDWQFKIEMLHGGLIEEHDPYPYWAPDNSYQPSFQFEISSNSIPWQNQWEQSFYIKTSQGQYGRMHFDISSAFTPARIQMDFTINPSGSQNLEPKP